MRITPLLIFLLTIILFLQSCASSHVTREANDHVAVAYQNTSSSFENLGNGSVADTFENASQSAKGAVIGGATGAVAGGLIHGVGVLPGLAIGAIVGGAYGAYISSQTTLLDRLENRGVKVMVLGDQIRIVLRSGRVFNDMSSVIRPGAYETLDLVSTYLNNYHTMLIQVAAYTNQAGNERVNLSLSKEQADNIVRYLKQRRINTRMLSASGLGDLYPVTGDDPNYFGAGLNNRIEITTQKLPVSGTLS